MNFKFKAHVHIVVDGKVTYLNKLESYKPSLNYFETEIRNRVLDFLKVNLNQVSTITFSSNRI